MICAAVTLSAIEDLNDNFDEINRRFNLQFEYEDSDDYEAAAGWLVFVAVIGMVIEPLIIILRILNIGFINQKFLIFGIVVSSFSVCSNSFKEEIMYFFCKNCHEFHYWTSQCHLGE